MDFQFQRTKRRTPRPDMMPMIDVVFFLLVFFMLFSTLRTTPMGLNVDLPAAVTGDPQQANQFEVSVSREGVFYVDNKMVTGPELRANLENVLNNHPDTFVIVKADKEVRYEYVVEALDQVRAVGGHQLGLAVEQRMN